MDILRKELNDIYFSQHLEEETLDDKKILEARKSADILSQISQGCVVITDASSDKCYVYSGEFGNVMGCMEKDTQYFEADSSDEDIIYERIHPEDLVDKRMLEYEFFKYMDNKHPDIKRNYIAKCRIRMKDRNGSYRIVENTTQLLTLSPTGKIWLILCTYNYSLGKDNLRGINPCIIDTSTGESHNLSFGEKRKEILSEREKEILMLIKEGNSSKMIADKLDISIHTVNRHRQNIIEKLSVGNSIEAVTAATMMNLL